MADFVSSLFHRVEFLEQMASNDQNAQPRHVQFSAS